MLNVVRRRRLKTPRRIALVNQRDIKDYSDEENESAFTIVDEKQPRVVVSIGGVPDVDSGASCNVTGRQLWESLKQNK